MTGTHPRHRYLTQRLSEHGFLCGLVVQERGARIPSMNPHSDESLRALVQLHFEGRQAAEDRFFGQGQSFEVSFPDYRFVTTDSELNSAETLAYILESEPDILLTYNVGIVSTELIANARRYAWNIHPGMVPWYRGAATHFWANYMLEPQMTGVTLHELTAEVDAGAIVHQSVAPMVSGDGLHDVANRAVFNFIDELLLLLERISVRSGVVRKMPQSPGGKLWRRADWRPEHLCHIYHTWRNRIVDAYIDGRIGGRTPQCFAENVR
jgi:hypothetical protein